MKNKAKIMVAITAALGLATLVGCGSSGSIDTSSLDPSSSSGSSEITSIEPTTSEEVSSEDPQPVQLGTVANLAVAHTSVEEWTITFDAVANSSGYKVQVDRGETSVVALTDITSGATLAAQSEDGVYTIGVKAIGDGISYTDGLFSEVEFEIENWIEQDVEGILFTGRIENDLPYGEFTLEYDDGSIYVGTLEDNLLRQSGRHTYPNNMYYEGEFVNDLFEGEGFFSWSTTGNYEDANYYEGQFIAGNTLDCLGTFSWTPRHNESLGGVMYWTGIQNNMGNGAKPNQQGEGAFRYLGNSLYTGGLYFDGANYLRVGFGTNLWTINENSAWITGGSAEKNIHGFVGEFDSVNHGWIFGDGIWYFNNTDGTPYGYITGTWDGGNRTGAISSFDAETDLLEEFKTATNLTPA